MKDILGAISADVVDSTSLTIEDMIGLRDEICNCFSDIKSCFPNSGFWGRLVKGDSIECCLDAPILSLRLVLLLKCRIKAWAADKSCSNALKELFLFFPSFQRAIGWCKIVRTLKESLIPEQSDWTRKLLSCYGLSRYKTQDLLEFWLSWSFFKMATRVVPRNLDFRPWGKAY